MSFQPLHDKPETFRCPKLNDKWRPQVGNACQITEFPPCRNRTGTSISNTSITKKTEMNHSSALINCPHCNNSKEVGHAPLYMDEKEVIHLLGISRSTIGRLMEKGEFPKKFHVSQRRVRWLREEVITWAKNRSKNSSPLATANSLGPHNIFAMGRP